MKKAFKNIYIEEHHERLLLNITLDIIAFPYTTTFLYPPENVRKPEVSGRF